MNLGILPTNISLHFVLIFGFFLNLNKDIQQAKTWITLQTHFGISERKPGRKNLQTSYV